MKIIAGPCAAEQSVQWLVDWACTLHKLFLESNSGKKTEMIFKASFDKANRTKKRGPRGLGLETTLKAFEKIKKETKLRVTTDIHECWQADKVKDIVDVLQIPAFLSRQTSLIEAAAATGRIVNIKKMQIMGMDGLWDAALKAKSKSVWVTYRGTQYGPNSLVVDPVEILDWLDWQGEIPLVLDITHTNTGYRPYSPHLGAVGVACGVENFFMEVHPNPEKAICDRNYQLDPETAKAVFEAVSRVSAL